MHKKKLKIIRIYLTLKANRRKGLLLSKTEFKTRITSLTQDTLPNCPSSSDTENSSCSQFNPKVTLLIQHPKVYFTYVMQPNEKICLTQGLYGE